MRPLVSTAFLCGALLGLGCDTDPSPSTADAPAKSAQKKAEKTARKKAGKRGTGAASGGQRASAASAGTAQLPRYDGLFATDPKLSAAAVATWPEDQLRIRRNEIYARYGRAFQSPDLQAHFGAQPWYEVRAEYSDALLTAHDRANAALIQGFEGTPKVWDGQVGELMFMDRTSLVISDADSMYGHEGEERHYVARGSKYVLTWTGPARFDLRARGVDQAELWTWTGRAWTRTPLVVRQG